VTAELKQLDRLERLVTRLLDASRLTTGAMALLPEPVDLRAVVWETVDRLRGLFEERGAALTLRGDDPVWGHWDPIVLDQIVTNLLSNALKYGRGQPVHVDVDSDGRVARVQVRDAGIGIASERLEIIFERFGRAVDPENYEGVGSGPLDHPPDRGAAGRDHPGVQSAG
jgi:signal transduction histidine kinase